MIFSSFFWANIESQRNKLNRCTMKSFDSAGLSRIIFDENLLILRWLRERENVFDQTEGSRMDAMEEKITKVESDVAEILKILKQNFKESDRKI